MSLPSRWVLLTTISQRCHLSPSIATCHLQQAPVTLSCRLSPLATSYHLQVLLVTLDWYQTPSAGFSPLQLPLVTLNRQLSPASTACNSQMPPVTFSFSHPQLAATCYPAVSCHEPSQSPFRTALPHKKRVTTALATPVHSQRQMAA